MSLPKNTLTNVDGTAYQAGKDVDSVKSALEKLHRVQATLQMCDEQKDGLHGAEITKMRELVDGAVTNLEHL